MANNQNPESLPSALTDITSDGDPIVLQSSGNALQTLDISEKTGLADPHVTDGELVAPRLFSTLAEDEKPIIPLPPDEYVDSVYQRFFEPRCQVCKSPWRELAEHVFLQNDHKVSAVTNFFLKYFGVKVYHEAVGTHMENHCDFSRLWMSGLASIERRGEDLARFKYRELDLAIMALMVELDDVRGIDCRKNNELKLKRAQMVERLATKLAQLKRERDEEGTASLDVFEVLTSIIGMLPHQECREIVLAKVRSIREDLAK